MDYQVLLLPAAARDWRKLAPELQARLAESLAALKEPRPPGARKLQGSGDRWRIRVGDYRIIYQINDSERKVIVNRIAHRRDAYRPS